MCVVRLPSVMPSASRNSVNDSSGEAASMDMMASRPFSWITRSSWRNGSGFTRRVLLFREVEINAVGQMQAAKEDAHDPVGHRRTDVGQSSASAPKHQQHGARDENPAKPFDAAGHEKAGGMQRAAVKQQPDERHGKIHRPAVRQQRQQRAQETSRTAAAAATPAPRGRWAATKTVRGP